MPTKVIANYADLLERYEKLTVKISCECEFKSKLVGGQPADEKGIALFVAHQLKLEGPAADEALKRIQKHEIGIRRLPVPETAELEETESKAVNVIRRDDFGIWLGDWMVKACIKNAASRVGIYTKIRGSKGDTAEMGWARAIGISLHEIEGVKDNSDHVYIRDSSGTASAPTEMETFKGRVNTPRGSQSIVTVSEVCAANSLFSFSFNFFQGDITDDDILDTMASSMIVGLGSGKAFERGKFRINSMAIQRGDKVQRGKSADLAERTKTSKVKKVSDEVEKEEEQERKEAALVGA